MTLLCRAHEWREFAFAAKAVEKGIGRKVRVGKESVLDTHAEKAQCGSFVSENRIGLSDLVHRLRIDHAVLLDPGFETLQDDSGPGDLLPDSQADGLSGLSLKQGAIELKGVIEVRAGLIEVLPVVLAKAAVKDDESGVIGAGQTV